MIDMIQVFKHFHVYKSNMWLVAYLIYELSKSHVVNWVNSCIRYNKPFDDDGDDALGSFDRKKVVGGLILLGRFLHGPWLALLLLLLFFPHASQFFGGSYACTALPSATKALLSFYSIQRKLSFYVLNDEGSKRREKGSKAIQHGTLVICSNAIWPRRQYPPRVRTKSEGQQNCQKRLRNDLLLAGFCAPIEEPTKHDLMVMRSALPV